MSGSTRRIHPRCTPKRPKHLHPQKKKYNTPSSSCGRERSVSEEFNVKNSVNLPRTAFPMKAKLAQNEPGFITFWDEQRIYHKMIEKNRNHPRFILHDGPPYANGHIHLGTALNKILKDIIVKYKSMQGFFSPYVPGWDCHGLPIEKRMEAELGLEAKQMDTLVFRQRCRQYALKYVGIQREEFKRLGGLGEWERPYLTMDHAYEANIARVFGDFVAKGSVYKGAKPVYWCISCQTALAEAEVEYADHESPSIYVKFPARSDFSTVIPELAGRQVFVVIWTTTPWTLPANLAIAFHPNFDYVAVEVGDEVLIIAEGLLNFFLADCNLERGEIVARFKGGLMDGLLCRHPFINRDSILVLADYVTLDQGTGCVHTAPGHGQEDYMTGQKYGLDILCPVDNQGCFTEEANAFVGMNVFEANPHIVDLMRENGSLIHSAGYKHSYPHCWRCRGPIVFRSTPQWFIAMDHDNLRHKALAEIRRARWIPAWGEERITNMVANRPDWCISRQRSWGVPIIAFYCKQCDHLLMSKDIVEYVATHFEAEGADAWYRISAQELLPTGTTCPSCGSTDFQKEFDILDVWFDSGVSYDSVSKDRPELPWPSDLYLEGGDQYRGWFHSSLLASLGCRDSAPYREVLTHGWVLDHAGHAMSKSLGNVIAPGEVIEKSGAEILRLWVGSVEYKEDVRISDEILSRLQEAYRKIRNTMRFLLGNLADFDPQQYKTAAEDLTEIDRWALARLNQLLDKCRAAYDAYNFHIVYHTIYQFCTVDLSAVYLDILKDRLYTAAADAPERRSSQTAIWEILQVVTRLLAPIMSFTAEEVWQYLREKAALPESIFLADFPVPETIWANDALLATWERLFSIRERVSKSLEEKRQNKELGNSLEARVVLTAGSDDFQFLAPYVDQLRYIFIVSDVTLEKGESPVGEPAVQVLRAGGDKCERCWNYSPQVGTYDDFPSVCERCIDVVRRLAGDVS
ncbi:MAG: isoleucine--tRNA ligase [Acidobacteria bacterium]|nr:isoleucine--tRNA ligase [Acidobacteriota bacterium]